MILQARDLDMLTAAAEGLTTQEMAGRAYVSVSTARNRLSHVMTLIGARGRGHAVAVCWPQIAHRVAVATPVGQLTQRQRQILALLAEGLTYQQIADKLFISRGTVNTTIVTGMPSGSLYQRLGAHNRAHAVAIGLAHRLIDPVSARPVSSTAAEASLTTGGLVELRVTAHPQSMVTWLTPAAAARLCMDVWAALAGPAALAAGHLLTSTDGRSGDGQ